jgi:hypothetical protein
VAALRNVRSLMPRMDIETVYRQRRAPLPPQEYRSRGAKRADRASAAQKAAPIQPLHHRFAMVENYCTRHIAIFIFHDCIGAILKC